MTAAAVPKAAGAGSSDAEAGAGLLAAGPTVEDGQQVDALGDSAYGTGEMLKALAAAGHRALVKPKPLAAAIAGGFTIDDFAYDKAAGNNRRLRCLRVAKNDAWFRLRAGAVNLKRLLSLGLTAREGAWAIA